MPESAALTVTAWIGAVLTVLGGLWKTITTIWKMAQRVADLWELVNYELTSNDGKSLKDQSVVLGLRLDELERIRLADEEVRLSRQAHVDRVHTEILTRLHNLDGGPTDVVGVPI